MAKQSTLDKDHQLEKLEFALAISQTIGDIKRSNLIKDQIKKIGFNFEEPGT